MPSLSLDSTLIARFAGGLYGLKIGAATMAEAQKQATQSTTDVLFNKLYAADFGSASVASVASTVVTNLGVTGTAAIAEATAFVTASLNAASASTRGAALASVFNQFAALTSNATYGAFATAYNAGVASAVTYGATAGTLDVAYANAASTVFSLNVGVENLVGTAGADTFNAWILNNANTLQSGDLITGGAGVDTLNADIGNSQNFAITAQTSGVEYVNIRAEAQGQDSNNNNMHGSVTGGILGPNAVQIDAERMADVTKWASVNSRADVIIEDVRINPGQKTSDITIEFTQSDPGNVDLGLYFNQLSLRNAGTSNSTLNIKVMDTNAAATAATAATPLLNVQYDTFRFLNNGTLISLTLPKANMNTTYANLLTGFQTALKTATVGGTVGAGGLLTGGTASDLSTVVTATLGAAFTVVDPVTLLSVTGTTITLQAGGANTITTGGSTGWYNLSGLPVPLTANIYNDLSSGATSTQELVTSKIILDDVGMGSTGGDLVVGGMSVGETSTSRGVERFEITVNDNSKLQTINGTNNALREVTIVNGPTTSTSNNVTSSNGPNATSTGATVASGNTAYTTTVANAGNLTVNGNVNLTSTGTGTVANTNSDTILKGVNNANGINGYTADHHGAWGFTDVRLIDGSAMLGKLAFTAQVTSDSIAKYVNLVDSGTATTPSVWTADVAGTGNVNFNVLGANFIYTGGTSDDTMVVQIDGTVAASRSTIVSGQSDFTFNISGGAGNDAITVSVVDAANVAGLTGSQTANQNWYNNQNLNDNVTISGGAGDDTIRKPGAGDTIIDAGAGNDVLYTENTGRQTLTKAATTAASSVLGTGTSSNATWVFNTWDQTVTNTFSARDIYNLRSDTNETYAFHRASLTVSFLGVASSAIVMNNQTTYRTTDMEINQAIKTAINNDSVLNKVLVAQDGPAHSLVITSLIDGARIAGDIGVTITLPTAATIATFSAAEATGAGTLAAMTTALALYTTNADYVSALATDEAAVAANITGANGVRVTDNFITPGTGNDVIVLSTELGATTDLSSNETVTTQAGFGNDVIFNFAVAGAGVDHLDFTWQVGAIPTVGAALVTTNNHVVVTPTAYTTATLQTAETTAFTGFAGASKQIVVSYTGSVGTVFSVTKAAGTAPVVTQEGQITLANATGAASAGTTWAALVAANFTAATDRTLEGLSAVGGGVVVPPVVPVGGAATVAVTAAGTTDANAPAGTNVTFNIATVASTYTYTVSNFAAGDVLNFGTLNAGTLPSIVGDVDQTDGIQSYALTTAGGVVTVTLTGLTAAQDAAIFNVPSFNTTFGAGSLI